MQYHKHALLYSSISGATITDIVAGVYDDQTPDQRVEQFLRDHQIDIWRGSDSFPLWMHHIKPSVRHLMVMGNHDLWSRRDRFGGVVGPRKISPYAQDVCQMLLDVLMEYDVVTVSGLADGVDQCIHGGSLDRGIPTIAILGGGLGYYYQHQLYRGWIDRIVQAGGMIISEYPLFFQPMFYSFPQRNRIIAGLSQWLVLPEAGKKSGSLITVDYALQYRVPVFVVPGSILSQTSWASNQLLGREGVHCLSDIAEWARRYCVVTDKTDQVFDEHVLCHQEYRQLLIALQQYGQLTLDQCIDLFGLGGLSAVTGCECAGLIIQKSGSYLLTPAGTKMLLAIES